MASSVVEVLERGHGVPFQGKGSVVDDMICSETAVVQQSLSLDENAACSFHVSTKYSIYAHVCCECPGFSDCHAF
jgi:hypothetical protein